MHTATIQKALESLEEANFPSYFEEMDKLPLSSVLKTELSIYKQQFMTDNKPWDFNQQLVVFTKETEKYLANPTAYTPPTTYQEQGKSNGTNATNQNVTIKGNQINANTIHTINTESKTSQQLKLFLYVFVPLLAIALAFFGWKYQELQQPLNLTVRLKNQTENPNLPFESGKVTLVYGDKTEAQTTKGEELNFKGIPANFRDKTIKLHFESDGFVPIKDYDFLLASEALELSIRRDNSLEKVFGIVTDSKQQAVANATVSLQDLTVVTDINGRFEFKIPLEKQRKKQRIRINKNGYAVWDYENPVLGTEIQAVLVKN